MDTITKDHDYTTVHPDVPMSDSELINYMEFRVKTERGEVTKFQLSRMLFLAGNSTGAENYFNNPQHWHSCGRENPKNNGMLIDAIKEAHVLQSKAIQSVKK